MVVRHSNGTFLEEYRHGGHPDGEGLRIRYVERQQAALDRFAETCQKPLMTIEFDEVRDSGAEKRRAFVRELAGFLGREVTDAVLTVLWAR